MVFYHEVGNQALLRKLHDFHKCGSCEANARESVIIEKPGIRQLDIFLTSFLFRIVFLSPDGEDMLRLSVFVTHLFQSA